MTDTTTPHVDEATAAQAAEAAAATKSGLRQLYLAALGFPLALADGLSHVFQDAVKQGEALEPQSREAVKAFTTRVGRAVDAPVQRTRTAVKDLGGRLRTGTSRGTEKIEERLVARLEKLGVPTREQLQALSDRVEALAAQIAELRERREG